MASFLRSINPLVPRLEEKSPDARTKYLLTSHRLIGKDRNVGLMKLTSCPTIDECIQQAQLLIDLPPPGFVTDIIKTQDHLQTILSYLHNAINLFNKKQDKTYTHEQLYNKLLSIIDKYEAYAKKVNDDYTAVQTEKLMEQMRKQKMLDEQRDLEWKQEIQGLQQRLDDLRRKGGASKKHKKPAATSRRAAAAKTTKK